MRRPKQHSTWCLPECWRSDAGKHHALPICIDGSHADDLKHFVYTVEHKNDQSGIQFVKESCASNFLWCCT